MDIKGITGNMYMDWRLLSRPSLTDVLVFKSYLQDVKQMMVVNQTYSVAQCGQGCQSPLWLETYRLRSGPSVCKLIWHNLGTAVRITMELLKLIGHNLLRGFVRLITSFTPGDICSRLITLKAKFQKILLNINKAMCSYLPMQVNGQET